MKKALLIAALVAAVSLLGVGAFFLAAHLSAEIGDLSLSFAAREEGYVREPRAGDGDYFYGCLSEDQQVLYDNIHRIACDFAAGGASPETEEADGEEVYILARFRFKDFSLKEGEAISAFVALTKDCPSFFFFVSVRLVNNGRWFAPVIAPEYVSAGALEEAMQAVESGAEEALRRAEGAETEAAKLRSIHDYVIGSTDYEWEAPDVPASATHAKNIVGVLDGDPRTGSICEGYSKAVLYLANRAGLHCLYVTGTEIAHAWNLAEAEGKWYVIDATNDDVAGGKGEYFLCSDQKFWELFSRDEPAYDAPEEGIYWQGALPAVEREDYGAVTLEGVTYKPWGNYKEMEAVSAEDAPRIEIAAEAGGMPVTSVSGGAFANCPGLVEAVLPESIVQMDTGLFRDCRQIERLTLPYLSAELAFLFDYAEGVPETLEEVSVTGGTFLALGAFADLSSLRRVSLPAGMEQIRASAFENSGIESVVLPKELRFVGSYAFYGCADLRAVYYMGTPADWEEIGIRSPSTNAALERAERFYYSEERPPEDGYAYWHYGADGQICAWE